MCTDENGKAVHQDCYVKRVAQGNSTESALTKLPIFNGQHKSRTIHARSDHFDILELDHS